ncbi:hypothetical protein KI387_021909, partial [Taxus chinensis]
KCVKYTDLAGLDEKVTTGPGELGTFGTEVREVHDSAGSDEKVTTGPGELGTFGMRKREVRGF